VSAEDAAKRDQARQNTARFECRPGATRTIPALTRLRFEYRDPNEPRLENFLDWTDQSARSIGERFGLDLAINPVGRIGATCLDPQVGGRIAATASALGLDYRVMASGTGHDAQVMARFCPTGLIFVPSVEGRSHCAEEATPCEAMIAGANVLLGTVRSFLLD
jgi:acetylornithine deacetylase/succinyl-diaminopimelate desuccinylase-like protein